MRSSSASMVRELVSPCCTCASPQPEISTSVNSPPSRGSVLIAISNISILSSLAFQRFSNSAGQPAKASPPDEYIRPLDVLIDPLPRCAIADGGNRSAQGRGDLSRRFAVTPHPEP